MEGHYYFGVFKQDSTLSSNISEYFYHKIVRFQFGVEINAFSNYICFDLEHTVVTDTWLKIRVHFLK